MKANIFLYLMLSVSAYGQTIISGKITDRKGESIPGVNITILDSYDGTSSDMNGLFSFSTSEQGGRTVLATFVGYIGQQVAVTLNGNPVKLAIELREEIHQLEAVTISAGSFTAGDEKRRTILKAIDIATTAGATADIAGALNTLPGTTKVGESGRLFVRGGDGNETRTFIDGMVVLDAYGPAAPNTPSRGRFLPFMFKGTSFSTGGYSAEYGQALSSALVLNSKDKAEFNQTDIGILSVGADVVHTQVWDRASASGKVQYTNLTPYFNLVDQRVDWHTPPNSIESSGAYRQQTGRDGLLKFFGNYNHSNLATYRHDIAQPELNLLTDLDNTYGYGNASYQQSLSDTWSVRGGVSYNYNGNKVKVGAVPFDEKENGTHAKVVFENSLSDRIEWRVGAESIVRDYTASTMVTNFQEPLSLNFREAIGASFLEGEWYTSKHFVSKVGARAEHNSLNSQASIDPRISLAYKPGKCGQYSFAYGIFRQSAKNELLRLNTSLGPERAEHFILNYQVVTGNQTFRVETYYKRYMDLVKYSNGNPAQSNNNGHGFAKGVELFWRDNRTVRNVDYWVSYSFLETERDYLNFPGAAVPAFASAHNFSFVYKHFITPIKSQLGLTYSFTSGRPYTNPNGTEFNLDRTPTYQDLSANISYLPRNWLIIHFSCTNLLGRDNIFGYSYAATPGADGIYASQPIRQPANRFVFLAVFITISKNKSVNQLPNL